jgi:hypothetical protein
MARWAVEMGKGKKCAFGVNAAMARVSEDEVVSEARFGGAIVLLNRRVLRSIISNKGYATSTNGEEHTNDGGNDECKNTGNIASF